MHVAQTCEAKFKHGNASSTSTNKREVRREEGRGKAWSWRNRHPNAPPQPLSGMHPKKKVRFEEPEDNGAVEVDEDVLVRHNSFCKTFGWLIGIGNIGSVLSGDKPGMRLMMRIRNGPQGINYWRIGYILKKDYVYQSG